MGGCDWYLAEYDGTDTFFGFAILHGDLLMADWDYMSFSELKSIKINGYMEIDCDLSWDPKPVREVELICKSQGWPVTNTNISTGGALSWLTLPN